VQNQKREGYSAVDKQTTAQGREAEESNDLWMNYCCCAPKERCSVRLGGRGG
jgi:hypothetical protein